jgi:hypothetical protein
MPVDISPLELIAELHRRQSEMYAGGSIDPVLELLPPDIIWHVPERGSNSASPWLKKGLRCRLRNNLRSIFSGGTQGVPA